MIRGRRWRGPSRRRRPWYESVFLALPFVAATAASAQEQPTTARVFAELVITAGGPELSRIGSLATTPAHLGEVVITQPDDHRILFFPSSGGAPAIFGRNGEGPGEFRNGWLAGTVGDSVWVSDPSTHRMTLIGPGHVLVRSVPYPSGLRQTSSAEAFAAFASLYPQAAYSDGSIAVRASLLGPGPKPRWAADQPDGSVVFVKASVDGVVQRVLGWQPPDACSVTYVTPSGSGGMRTPYCAAPMSSLATDGHAALFVRVLPVANGIMQYELTLIGASGDTLLKKLVRYQGVPIPQTIVDSVIADGVRRSRSPQQAEAWRSIRIPSTYPPVKRALIGGDGTVWLEIATRGPDHIWDILNIGGGLLGRMSLPDNVQLQFGDLSHLWTTRVDADGIESVVRFNWQPTAAR